MQRRNQDEREMEDLASILLYAQLPERIFMRCSAMPSCIPRDGAESLRVVRSLRHVAVGVNPKVMNALGDRKTARMLFGTLVLGRPDWRDDLVLSPNSTVAGDARNCAGDTDQGHVGHFNCCTCTAIGSIS